MVSKFDIRQAISRDLLGQLAPTANQEVDNLLRSINSEVTPPLNMYPDTGLNRVLKIADYNVVNPETGKNRSIPPIHNNLPTGITFPITITFPAASGGTITISGTTFTGGAQILTIASGNYIKIGLNL